MEEEHDEQSPDSERSGGRESAGNGRKQQDHSSDKAGHHDKNGNGDKDEGGEDADQDNDDDKENKPAMDPRKKRRFIIIAAIVLLVVIVIAILWWLHARHYESTDDAYIDAYIVHVSPQIAGRVQHVYVSDDMRVHAGQLLVEIDSADANARLNQALAQEAQAEAQVAQAQAGLRVRRASYDQARASARAAAVQASTAESDLARYRGLQKTLPEAVASRQLDQARATAVNASAQRESAKQQIGAAAAQIDAAQTQINGAAAALKTAQAQVEQARISLGYTRVVASEDGTVANRNVAVGNTVAPGTQMLAIVPFKVWVTANFKETQLDLMKHGQKVDIAVDAFPHIKFHGHVDSIQRGAGQAFQVLPAQNATGNFIKVVQRVPVKIIIDGPRNALGALGPGMSVSPRVHVR